MPKYVILTLFRGQNDWSPYPPASQFMQADRVHSLAMTGNELAMS